jgi:hypothetical protein
LSWVAHEPGLELFELDGIALILVDVVEDELDLFAVELLVDFLEQLPELRELKHLVFRLIELVEERNHIDFLESDKLPHFVNEVEHLSFDCLSLADVVLEFVGEEFMAVNLIPGKSVPLLLLKALAQEALEVLRKHGGVLEAQWER